MTGWAEFAAAFAAFFISHRVPMRPATRARAEAVLGKRGFILAYSALSLAILVWLVVAAGRAPYVTLWPREPWQAWVPVITMAPVCLLLAFSIARANPLSFGAAQDAPFDPAHPGLLRWVRHPLLLALALWAGAHVVPNGDLAHVILFGLFAGFALLGMKIMDRRKRRLMGAERWRALTDAIHRAPALPHPASWRGAGLRVLAAVLLYGLLIFLHPVVIGVSPLP